MHLDAVAILVALLLGSAGVVEPKPIEPRRNNSAIDLRVFHIEEIKSRIKASFGALLPQHLPAAQLTPEQKVRIHAELQARREQQNRDSTDAAEEITSRDLYNFKYLGGEHSYHYKFAVNVQQTDDAGHQNRVESATLRLYKESVWPHNLNDSLNVATNIVLSVYQVLAVGLRRLVSASAISLAEPGWVSLDVTEAVQNWLDEPLANLGLLVDTSPQSLPELVNFASADSGESTAHHERTPTLEARIYQQSWRRRRRRDSNKAASSHPRGDRCAPGQCCRKRVSISFADDLGWDWVVEPASFDAYYCEGGCTGDYVAANNFAEVKKTLRRRNPGLRNRCTPMRYAPLDIAHLDRHNNLIITEKEDMIVEECGCA